MGPERKKSAIKISRRRNLRTDDDRHQTVAQLAKGDAAKPQPSRRRLLKSGAVLAIAGTSAYAVPKVTLAAHNDGLSPVHEQENFSGIDTSDFGPLTGDAPIEITALDFTRGLSSIIDSIASLNSGIKNSLLGTLSDIEAAVEASDAILASSLLSQLLADVSVNAVEIDLAVGVFGFEEVVSFSQVIISQTEFLLSLGAEVVGVIYVFEEDLLLKIVETFTVLQSWFTTTVITQWSIYASYWLFSLTLRFRLFPGPSLSIDYFLLYICVCLQLTITSTVVICMREVRSKLILVEC